MSLVFSNYEKEIIVEALSCDYNQDGTSKKNDVISAELIVEFRDTPLLNEAEVWILDKDSLSELKKALCFYVQKEPESGKINLILDKVEREYLWRIRADARSSEFQHWSARHCDRIIAKTPKLNVNVMTPTESIKTVLNDVQDDEVRKGLLAALAMVEQAVPDLFSSLNEMTDALNDAGNIIDSYCPDKIRSREDDEEYAYRDEMQRAREIIDRMESGFYRADEPDLYPIPKKY